MSLVFIPAGKVTNSFLKYIPNHLEKPLKYSNVNKNLKQIKKEVGQKRIQEKLWKPKAFQRLEKMGQLFPRTGKSIVIDNKTNEIFHVGGEGFKYDY